jgi:hypothetical protein
LWYGIDLIPEYAQVASAPPSGGLSDMRFDRPHGKSYGRVDPEPGGHGLDRRRELDDCPARWLTQTLDIPQ